MARTSSIFNQYSIFVGLFSVLLYMYGFFPIKSSTNIYSSREDFPTKLNDFKFHKEKLYNSSVGKTVLMVIDGIRVDFVTEENMPYTAGLVSGGRGAACQLTARVSAPTVTLPRVKAIATGSVSSYIDVVLNFGTKELSSDSIIEQAARTKKVLFYGDDTWIKLFPRQFTRSEGTVSFFVNDYTEVDSNVTRHLDVELQKSDWGLMVLHYLGLDHIGHIQGPKSSLIKPKLQEMDDVIARLHAYLQKEAGGVLLVCGDHGMKDSGSHGGVSLPELLVPVVVLGLTCPMHYKEEILQVDLAATLSVLWGAPIPADSIGVVVAGLLAHLSPAHRLYAWLYNAQQLATNFLRNGGTSVHESYKRCEEAKQSHYQWLSNSTTVTHLEVEAAYQTCLIQMSRFLSEVLANYDMIALFTAISLVLQVVFVLALKLLGAEAPARSKVYAALSLSTAGSIVLVAGYRFSSFSSLSTWPFIVSIICVLLIIFNAFLIHQHLKSARLILKIATLPASVSWRAFLPVGTALFCISLFSSSLIEEEHDLWYFMWSTVAALRLVESPSVWLCVMAGHRFLRSLNQTGDKWAHLPDLSDWLALLPNQPVLSVFCISSLALLFWCCTQMMPRRLSVLFYLATALCVYLHKAAIQQVFSFTSFLSSSGVSEARLCWLLLALLLLMSRSLDSLIVCWMLLSSLLLRSYNIILVPALFLVSRTVFHLSSPSLATTVLHYWLGLVFFFYQGNSNSLASIDLAAGYVGLEEYNMIAVGVLLFAHTYSMPVLAYLLNIRAILKQNKCWKEDLTRTGEMLVFLHLLHVFMCLIVITLHRYHLFVWTVFSPKLMYVVAQTVLYFLLISITNLCVYCSHKLNIVFFKYL